MRFFSTMRRLSAGAVVLADFRKYIFLPGWHIFPDVDRTSQKMIRNILTFVHLSLDHFAHRAKFPTISLLRIKRTLNLNRKVRLPIYLPKRFSIAIVVSQHHPSLFRRGSAAARYSEVSARRTIEVLRDVLDVPSHIRSHLCVTIGTVVRSPVRKVKPLLHRFFERCPRKDSVLGHARGSLKGDCSAVGGRVVSAANPIGIEAAQLEECLPSYNGMFGPICVRSEIASSNA